jgi:hypothetical protein
LISFPSSPTARWTLITHPDRGVQPFMIGGLRHTALYKGWGASGSRYEVLPQPLSPPTTLISNQERGAVSDGKRHRPRHHSVSNFTAPPYFTASCSPPPTVAASEQSITNERDGQHQLQLQRHHSSFGRSAHAPHSSLSLPLRSLVDPVIGHVYSQNAKVHHTDLLLLDPKM